MFTNPRRQAAEISMRKERSKMPGSMKPKKNKERGKLFMRLMSYIFKNYGLACVVVVICIFITALSSVQGTMFMQTPVSYTHLTLPTILLV